jgi:hypothetical protein
MFNQKPARPQLTLVKSSANAKVIPMHNVKSKVEAEPEAKLPLVEHDRPERGIVFAFLLSLPLYAMLFGLLKLIIR